MRCNWIKMYDRGPVLRVETVINNPEEFRIRKRVRREGRDVMAWVPLRKSVTLLWIVHYCPGGIKGKLSERMPSTVALESVRCPLPSRTKVQMVS